MSLFVASSSQCEALFQARDFADCACDREKVGLVRMYLHERFPDRPVHDFHSRSTVVVDGGLPVPCANYHVVSVSNELPYCAVLTSRFMEQPVRELREHLRHWDLAGAIQVASTVVVDRNGLSQL